MKISTFLGVGALLCLASPGFSTILTFDSLGLADAGSIVDYGSNATAACTGSGQTGCVVQGIYFTPDIAVSFRSLTALGNGPVDELYTDFWDNGYGDLVNVSYAASDGDYAEVTLTPQNGFSVILNSFDLAGYDQVDITGQSVRVFNWDYSRVLYSYDGTIHGAGPTHDSFKNLNIMEDGPVHIQFGPSYDVGIDNINFDEGVTTWFNFYLGLRFPF